MFPLGKFVTRFILPLHVLALMFSEAVPYWRVKRGASSSETLVHAKAQ